MTDIPASQFDFHNQVQDLASEYYSDKTEIEARRLGRFHLAIRLVVTDDDVSDDEIFLQTSADFNDKGIDFFWASESGENRIIHVVQVKDHEKISADGQKAAVAKMINEIRRLVSSDPNSLDERSLARYQDLTGVKAGLDEIVFHIVLTGEQQTKFYDDTQFGQLPCSYSIEKDDRSTLLARMSRQQGLVKPSVSLEWATAKFADLSNRGIRVISGYIPVKDFVVATQPWGQDLFNLNPRLYLETLRKGPNKQMLETLSSDSEREYFHLFNNGITAVCDSIDIVNHGDVAKMELANFQVVNGCQTTNTLWKWYKLNSNKSDSTLVPLRLIESSHLAPKISIFTNSQNAINFLDLMSTNPAQMRIKQALESMSDRPVFYENRRGSWEATGSKKVQFQIRDWKGLKGTYHRRISTRDLAQYLLAVTGQPFKSKENLSDMMNEKTLDYLLTKSWDSAQQLGLVADIACLLSKRDYLQDQAAKSNFIATGKFVVSYLIYRQLAKGVSETDFHVIDEDNKLQKLISPEASLDIRKIFLDLVRPLIGPAIRAIDTAMQMNPDIGPRNLLRSKDNLRKIEIIFENMVQS